MVFFWRLVYGVPIVFLGVALWSVLPLVGFADVLYAFIHPYSFFLLLNVLVCLSCLLLAVKEFQQKDQEAMLVAVIYLFTSVVYASFYFTTFKDFFFANYFGRGVSLMAFDLKIFFYTIDTLALFLLVGHYVMRRHILEGKSLKKS